MQYQFDWSVLWRGQSGVWLLQGLLTTLEISALAWLLALALGVLSGALRTVPFRPLRALASEPASDEILTTLGVCPTRSRS